MKKIIALILFALIVGLFIVKIRDKNEKNNLSNTDLASIPHIEIYALDGSSVMLDEISTRSKTIIIFFSTDCDICHIEARDFLRMQNAFKDSSIIFISNNSNDEINEFILTNKLEKSGFIFLNDRNNLLSANHDIPTTPFILIYINNQLYKTHKGAVKVEQIIKDKGDK